MTDPNVADDFTLPGEGDQQQPTQQTQQQQGSGLRRQLEDALAAQRAAEARLAEYATRERAATIANAVKEAGLADTAAGLYPKDAEATPEAVKTWAEQLRAAVGTPQQQPGQQPGQQPAGQPTGLQPADIQAIRAAQLAAASATDGGAAVGLEGLHTRMNDWSVPWPQLAAEMQAMGFHPPDEV